MLTTARRLRNDLKVFYVTHSESIEDDGHIVGQKIKTIGKALDSQIVMLKVLWECLNKPLSLTTYNRCVTQ
jgi:hypothetical protein